ncbi:MAG: hypothetical protein FWC70_02310 [Defluviitaleaceae bacterium]|nr:hypothetical protein [Defluviitaleaceae bacterium]
MLEVNDYSNRRGIVVPMLPKIHAMLAEIAARDKHSEPPEHVIIWSQKMRKILMDINRRFIIALDGKFLAGIFFYRHDGGNIYIEDLQVAWVFRNNPGVIDGFLQRLEYDSAAKDATFFASERVKSDADQEILAAKGFKRELEDGWENFGTLAQASAAIKVRYGRGA